MNEVTAPPGRVYAIPAKAPLSTTLAHARALYSVREGKQATWLRVHPDRFPEFAALWPGCVIADDRVVKATLMLGVD